MRLQGQGSSTYVYSCSAHMCTYPACVCHCVCGQHRHSTTVTASGQQVCMWTAYVDSGQQVCMWTAQTLYNYDQIMQNQGSRIRVQLQRAMKYTTQFPVLRRLTAAGPLPVCCKGMVSSTAAARNTVSCLTWRVRCSVACTAVASVVKVTCVHCMVTGHLCVATCVVTGLLCVWSLATCGHFCGVRTGVLGH